MRRHREQLCTVCGRGFLGNDLDGQQQDPDHQRDHRDEVPVRLLKPTEIARRLAVSRSWVYAAATDGRLPSVRLGDDDGPLRFIAADVESWIEGARAGWRPDDSGASALRRPAETS